MLTYSFVLFKIKLKFYLFTDINLQSSFKKGPSNEQKKLKLKSNCLAQTSESNGNINNGLYFKYINFSVINLILKEHIFSCLFQM